MHEDDARHWERMTLRIGKIMDEEVGQRIAEGLRARCTELDRETHPFDDQLLRLEAAEQAAISAARDTAASGAGGPAIRGLTGIVQPGGAAGSRRG
jgi:hypothetical protein